MGTSAPPLATGPIVPRTPELERRPLETPDPARVPLAPPTDPPAPATAAGAAFVASRRPDPARWTQVLQLAQRLNVSPDFADRNFDELTRGDDKFQLEATVNSASPTLGNWLDDPDHLAIARQEIPAVTKIDASARRLQPPDRMAPADATAVHVPRWPAPVIRATPDDRGPIARGVATGYNDLAAAAGQLGAAFGLLSPDEAAVLIADHNQRAADLRAQQPDYAKEYAAALEAESGNVDRAAARVAAASKELGRGQILQGLRDFGSGSIETVGQVLELVRAAATHPRGLGYSLVEGAASMAPALVAGSGGAAAGAAIGSVVPVVGTAAGGTLGLAAGTFLGMAPVNVGSEINRELAQRHVDITDPVALRAALSDPQLMVRIRSAAAREGLTSAAVASLVGSVAGKLSVAAKDASPLIRSAATAADVGAQAAGMGAADLAGQAARDPNEVSVGRAAESGISMLGYSLAHTGLSLSRRAALPADPADAAVQVHTDAASALRAEHDADALAELGAAVRDAKQTAAVPSALKDLIEVASGGGETPAQVYFQADAWDRYWRGQQIAPAKAVEDITGDASAYDQARATGALIAIPLADYVTHVAPSAHFDGLLPIAQLHPDGMSLAEARTYLQSIPATLQQLATEVHAPTPDPADAIASTIREQLRGAGRPAREAELGGKLTAAAYRTLADRTGVDALELFNRYRVTIRRGEAPADAAALQQEHAPLLRGQISFGEHGEAAIDLFQAANASTFVHESGHFYLNVLHDLSTREETPAAVKADYATVRSWLGAEGETPLTRSQHEQFARGFETYLAEGKAPSTALQNAFSRFRQWLTKLYGSAQHLGAPISEEVRGVFGRLLATDAELAQAQQLVLPLFPDPAAAGMSADRAAKYQAQLAAARQAAEEQVTQRVMTDLQRQRSSEWRARRRPIETDVTAQIDADPIHRAIALLRKGTKPDGSPLEAGLEPMKLSKAALVAEYGRGILNGLPHDVYAEKDGLHPDLVATMLGFDSGRTLVDGIRAALPRDRAIRAETDRRMQAEHGSPMDDAQLRQLAHDAVHNEHATELLREELRYLVSDHFATFKGIARDLAKTVRPTDATRSQAAQLIGRESVRRIRPDLYEAAAARASREAAAKFAAGDFEGAYRAKDRQLLATETYRAAATARDAIEAALQEFRKPFRRDASLVDRYDLDTVNAARAILAEYGIGRAEKAPAEYLEQMKRYDPATYEGIAPLVDAATAAADALRRSGQKAQWKNLSFDDFTALREVVGSLMSVARRSREIEIDGKRLDRQAVATELGTRLEALTPAGARPGAVRAVTPLEAEAMSLRSVSSSLRRVEHWVRQIDGGADGGPFRRYVWQPIADAATRFRIRRVEIMERYRAIVDELKPTMQHGEIPAPELGYTFRGKAELLGALLHSGNASNMQKLLRGGRGEGHSWGDFDPNTGALDRGRWDAMVQRMWKDGILTKRDYDYVQAVWDLFEHDLKPDAQRAQKEVYGHYFAEITAEPFSTPFGEYRGGYYPALADPLLVPDRFRRLEAESILQSDNSGARPATSRGFTKSRNEAYARPLILDATKVPLHLDAELRFTHLNPRVVDVSRLILDPGLRDRIDGYDPDLISGLLDPWLRRVAKQSIDTPSKGKAGRWIDDKARMLRRNAGLQILSGSLTVAAEQLTHLPAVLLRVGPRSLARGFWEFTRAPRETAEFIRAKSEYMKTRETAGLQELRAAVDRIMLDPSVYQSASAWLNEHGSFLTRGIQHVEDHMTWLAAYDESYRASGDETAAVRHADAIIREVLGAYEPESISSFEASSPTTRLFTMFMGFFLNRANFLKTEFTTAARDVGLRKGAARLFAVYTAGFLLPGAMAQLIKQQLRNEDFDEDGDGPWNDVLDLVWRSQVDQAARMVPFGGPLVEGALEHFGKGHGPDVVSSPALRLLEDAAAAPGDVYHAIREGLSKTELTDIFTLLGLLTGTPLRPLAKPAGHAAGVAFAPHPRKEPSVLASAAGSGGTSAPRETAPHAGAFPTLHNVG